MTGNDESRAAAKRGRELKAEKERAKAGYNREGVERARQARLEKLAAQNAPGNTGPPAAPTGERLIMIFTVCSP